MYSRHSQLIKRLAVAFMVLTFAGVGRGQSPGNANTYLFIDCGVDSFVPPGPSTLCFDLKYHIEGTGQEKIFGFMVPIKIRGTNNCLASIDTTVAGAFPPASGIHEFTFKNVGLVPSGADTFWIVYGAIDFFNGATGDSLFASICLEVTDTGTVFFDTATPPDIPSWTYQLTQEDAKSFTPGWGGPAPYSGYPPV